MDMEVIAGHIQALQEALNMLKYVLLTDDDQGNARVAGAVNTHPTTEKQGYYSNWNELSLKDIIPLLSFVSVEELKKAVNMAWKFNFMEAAGRKSIKKVLVDIKKHTVTKKRRFPRGLQSHESFVKFHGKLQKEIMDVLIACDVNNSEDASENINAAKESYYRLLRSLQSHIDNNNYDLQIYDRQSFESAYDLKWSSY